MTTPYAARSDPRRPARATLVLTRSAALVDVLERLAAAAGAELDVRGEPPVPARWAEPGLVLVGPDLAAVVAATLPRRPGLALVTVARPPVEAGPGVDGEDAEIWRLAVDLGAERVAFLPDAQEWVVEALADSLEGSHRCAAVAVVGGCGGAGASVLACAIAVGAAVRGHRALLVDLDPLGGGVDRLLGADDVPGLRWSELARARGRLSGGMLREALPRLDGLSVLAWDRADAGAVSAAAATAVAAGAARGFDLVVLDLPRSLSGVAPAWLRLVDLGLVVVPSAVHATAAATRVVAGIEGTVADLRAVVRGPSRAALPAELVADALEIPLLGELRAEPGLAAALERGEPPGLRSRGPLARMASRVLDDLFVSRAAA